MNEKRLRVAKPVLVAATLATIVWVSAGDLNPPPGPIAPTQRTPVGDNTTPGDALSVFKIIQPGSYYLTGNVKGVVGEHGIEIDASGVTLDLMGFEVAGVAGSLEGIHVTNPVNSIAVINGSVRNWDRGVNFSGALNTRAADLRVSGNVTDGILAGVNAVVTGCVAYLNGGRGIVINSGSMSGCSAYNNTGTGLVGLGAGQSHLNFRNRVSGHSNAVRLSGHPQMGNAPVRSADVFSTDTTVRRGQILDAIALALAPPRLPIARPEITVKEFPCSTATQSVTAHYTTIMATASTRTMATRSPTARPGATRLTAFASLVTTPSAATPALGMAMGATARASTPRAPTTASMLTTVLTQTAESTSTSQATSSPATHAQATPPTGTSLRRIISSS